MKSLSTGLLILSVFGFGACAMDGSRARQNFALLVAGGVAEPDPSNLKNVEGYLGSLKDSRAAAGPSGSVDVQVLRGTDAGAANFYAELAARLLHLRKSGGDLFVYWTGPARGQGDDVLLGADAAAIELRTVRSLLQIAPQANVLIVINSAIEGAQRENEGQIVQACATRAGHCIWIAQPIGAPCKANDIESWAGCFRLQLESTDASGDMTDCWRRMRAALVKACAEINKPTMSDSLGNPSGMWWLWQHGQPPRAAPIEPAPVVTPPPPADAPRTD